MARQTRERILETSLAMFNAQGETNVTIKPDGKDSGTKPWKKAPSEVKFEVPSDYRIIVRSSFAGYLADWLIDAAEEFGVSS